MNELKFYDETRKTNIKSTLFTDGMVVTADDLDTAMRYPIDLFQTLVRAYFGCGIVCGFEVDKYPKEAKDMFCVKIGSGVALDCHGHPLQLCEGETIDLTPDPCACDEPPKWLCIAIRRDTMPEAPRADGGDCDDNGKPSSCYGRERELVRIKVFKPEDLPKTLCAHPNTRGEEACEEENQDDKYGADEKQHYHCKCLKTCPGCDCCGEAWVLLACVKLGECGVEEVDDSVRKYIKPIECLCPSQPKERYSRKEEHRQENYSREETPTTTRRPRPKKKAVAKKRTGKAGT